MNDDVVTKYALQNEVPSTTILNSVDIPVETRALARLAGHKFVIDAVQSFRNKFPDWKLSIADLLNELGSKYRDKKKSNIKKTVKVKKVETKILKTNDKPISDSDEFENIQSESEDDVDSAGYETDSNKSNITEENNSNEIIQVEKSLAEENNTSSEEDQDRELIELKPENSNQTINIPDKKKSKCDKNESTSQLKNNVIDKQISKLVNKQLSEKILNSSTNKSTNDIEVELNEYERPKRKAEKCVPNIVVFKKKRTNEDDIKPVCETVDSFFMTADNKDYMSVYKPPPVVETNDEEELPRLDYQKPAKEIFIKGKKITLGKRNNMGNRRERRQQQVEEPVDTVLHPSWEAKRKQKSLAKFEGKKITFDDQD